MTALAQTLDQIRNTGAAKRPPEITATLKRCTTELQAAGIVERIVKVGDSAPLFARPNLDYKTIRLSRLLKNGPVVVSFFRGRW